MSPRTTVAAGLLSGAAVTIAALLAAVVLIPDSGVGAGSSASLTPSDGTSASPVAGGCDGSAEPTVVASIGEPAFHVGEAAPALRVPQLGGGEIDLANLAGRPVWISFIQTTCPPCVDELPLLNGFAARYADTGLVVIAIDTREDEGTVAAFARRINATIPIGLDADGAAQTVWHADALPVHFWVDRAGIIRAGALGGIGPDAMAERLSTILPGVIVTQ